MAWFSDQKEVADIKELLGMLKNSDLKKRNLAARELLKIGEPSAEGLISLLSSQETVQREMASRILVSLDKKALFALNATMPKASFAVKEEIIIILGQQRDESALETLYKTLKEEDYKLRILTANVLGKSKNPKVVPHLLVALSDADPDVRISAVSALGNFRDQQTYVNIADLLDDAEINVRIAAAKTLGKTKDPNTISYLVNALHDSFWWYGRDDAIQILLGVIASFKKAALDDLIKVMKAKDPSVRRYAIELLRPLREPRIMESLEMAFYDTNYDVSESALAALLEFGKNALPILEKALISPNIWIREKAVWGLGEIGEEQSVIYLLEMLSDDAESVRKASISSLSKLKDPRALPTLRALSQNRGDKEVSRLARQAIAEIEAI